MKHKLIIVGLCAFVALVFLFAGKKGDRKVEPATHSLVVTQHGRLTIQPAPNTRATMVVIGEKPKPSDDTPSKVERTRSK